MTNHFRTLLLNLAYIGDQTEHIPSGYAAANLPAPLQAIHKVLFPVNTSRLYKTFLVQNYLNLIDAAGLSDEILLYDPRISYTIDNNDFFKIYRTSNPIASSTTNEIFVYGKYNGNQSNDNFYDSFLVSQVTNTNSVTVYSLVRGVYVKDNQTFSSASDAIIAVDFSNPNTSKPIYIGSTGLYFTFNNGSTFTSSSNKTWEFLAEAPYIFNFNDIMAKLKTANVDDLFRFKTNIDTTKYQNYWKLHFNPVYRLSGLLLAYVKKLDSTLW